MPRGTPGLVVLFLGLAILVTGPAAAQTTPADLCTGNPCQISATITLDHGTPAADLTLDFGAVPLVFTSAARVTVGGPGRRKVLFRAQSITLQPGAQILGSSDGVTVAMESTAGGIAVNAAGATKAKIDVDGNTAGTIDLRAAGGDVTVNGILTAHGSGEDATGGTVTLVGGSVVVTSPVDASGTGPSEFDFTTGGTILIAAVNDITVSATLDASSSDGTAGTIALLAFFGDVATGGQMKANGDGATGEGGGITIRAATGGVVIGGAVAATGSSGTDDGDPVCGNGGTLVVWAHETITLAAPVTLTPGLGCSGGIVAIEPGTAGPFLSAGFITDADFVQQAGAIVDIHASGNSEDVCGVGGDVYIAAKGDADLQRIDVGAACEAGTIIANAGGTATVADRLDASTSGAETTGGYVSVRACSVIVPGTGEIDTAGKVPGTTFEGRTVLQASGTMTVAGDLTAEIENRLEYKTTTPVTAGASFDPPAQIVPNTTLADCAIAASCGDGDLDAGETCDDGNIVDCDGCRGDCSRADRVCGDSTVECGETCDDGNAVGGDGCSATCALEGPEVLEFQGSPTQSAGCLAQWRVWMTNGVFDSSTGKPKRTQRCTDGDPACDRDGGNDLGCDYDVQVCLRRTDGQIPGCNPAAIAYVKQSAPSPLSATGLNLVNAQTITGALQALGVEVRSGTTVVAPGTPQAAQNNCTERFTLRVPRGATRSFSRQFRIAARDVNDLSMDRNEIQLSCYPNAAVCGNGLLETFETCDDNNDVACDGCSSRCRLEACGNGVRECAEACDDGALNGTPGSRCSAQCTALPPPLRIPGGGARPLDCAFQWSAELNPGQLQVDRRGVPRNSQVCTDGDVACDFDPTPGTCRMRLWSCLGGADAGLGCAAANVSSVDILTPKPTASGSQLQARLALFAALQALGLPAGPGEECTAPLEVDVPVGKKSKLKLKTKSRLASGPSDADQLTLECLAP